eukprot:TRINITY_DN2136_c0_g1_i1.p1 TRINITY_DN2136_c0_g1~~TRINITY_DN2136_c0_g1_i1.p1  ORF type:complete len:688 (-),score=180.13 TRINITY_DN2136_c0_g1_i1:35-2098(-)
MEASPSKSKRVIQDEDDDDEEIRRSIESKGKTEIINPKEERTHSHNGHTFHRNGSWRDGRLSDDQLKQDGDFHLAMKLQKEEDEEFQRNNQSKREQTKRYSDDLKSKDWYFGRIDREEAEAILLRSKCDSFLLRESSVPGSFAVSLFEFKSQKIAHTLIQPLDYGTRYYQLQQSPRMFATLEELIDRSPELQGYQLITKEGKRRSETSAPLAARLADAPSDQGTFGAEKLRISEAKPEAGPASPRRTPVNESPAFFSSIDAQDVIRRALKALEDSGAGSLRQLKESLKILIEDHEQFIQEYDKILVAKSIELREEVKLPDADNERYLEHMNVLAKLKDILQRLRMKGDEFRIIHKQENKLFKVNSEGQMMFCNIKRTADPTALVPSDMSKFVYFNVGVVEGSSNTAYEVTSSRAVHYIDELDKVAPDVQAKGERGGGCVLYWKNNKKSTFNTAIPSEAEELIEVVGCHLKKFKQSTIKQIQLLKDIWKCKSTKFDAAIPQHAELLRRFWMNLKPKEPYMGDTGEKWKEVGFQGVNPSTDFRGMGLLGLLNLIYFSEHYRDRAQNILSQHRDYPFAVTGINITSTLINLLNLTKDLVNAPAPDKSWHTALLNLFYYADNEDTFDELYSQSFLLFDKLWVYEKATYMTFPTVIRRLQQLLEELLIRKPLDVKQLIAWIEQLQVSFETSL